jgi:hypothetical protein
MLRANVAFANFCPSPWGWPSKPTDLLAYSKSPAHNHTITARKQSMSATVCLLHAHFGLYWLPQRAVLCLASKRDEESVLWPL